MNLRGIHALPVFAPPLGRMMHSTERRRRKARATSLHLLLQ